MRRIDGWRERRYAVRRYHDREFVHQVFAQVFTAGSALSFDLNLTTNLQTGLTPDQFGFAILDPSGKSISTSDPTGDDKLGDQYKFFQSAVVTYSDIVTVTPEVGVPTPEPNTIVFLTAALLLFALLSRDRKGSVSRAYPRNPNLTDPKFAKFGNTAANEASGIPNHEHSVAPY